MDDRELAALQERRAAELREERRRAREAGQEYADELDLGIQIDPGTPMPHLFANGHSVFVLFYLRAPIPARITAAGSGYPAGEEAPLGLVEFTGVHTVLFGGPNDEALNGHHLYGKGLQPYAIHEVRDSSWISEAEHVNSVHPYHQGGWHAWLRHFVITFHDETLECLARDIRAQTRTSSFPEAAKAATSRMLDWWQR
jgi:hypothetical protein